MNEVGFDGVESAVRALLSCLLIGLFSDGSGLAQSNPVAPRAWFSLPSAQLRPVLVENDIATDSFALTQSPGPLSVWKLNESETSEVSLTYRDQVILNRYPGEFDYRTYRLLHEESILKRSEPKPDDLFSRLACGIFEPEPLRIGKTTVCCSLVTAIKRKNPLCLLSPMVLNVSW